MDLEAWLAELTLDEKAELTAGADMWSTPAIERAGLPAVRVTDGPNGARGQALLGLGTVTAACIPCGSALGASWNPELVERLGVLLGEEAHTKAARVLLAPTINLHRSPLGGRNFECLSEDPLLAGKLAAAYVRGVQSQGVATTAKHFVANEAEFERHTIDSVVDERTLRELYLVPFELVVKEGGGLGVMTSYNRVNGEYCSESAWLLSQVLREEWGFQGFIVTDWFAAGDTVASLRAGLDLQMPGPGRFFGEALAAAVRDGRVDEAELDAPVARMLSVWERLGALEDTGKDAERSVDLPEHRTLAREAAREAIVLLRNDGTLPLDASGLQRVAVIGPNAERGQIMGGGSAALRPHYRVGPLEALRAALPSSVEVVYERGCWTERTIPALGGAALARGGEPGFEVELFTNPGFEGRPAQVLREHEAEFLYFGEPAPGIPAEEFSLRARTTFTPRESGRHTFSLIQSGRAQLAIGDQIVIDGVADPPARGEAFFSMGSAEVTVEVELVAGEPVELSIEYSTDSAVLLRGVRIGHKPPASQDDLARAERAAAAADAVVLVVGTNADWESEGEDRGSMDLPGEQDALIRRVCAANPRTIVCVNAGSPVTMDWAELPAALLQTWFGGQELGNALADVLLGRADPGGRLPTTIPQRIEHNPTFGNFPGENSKLRYGEALLVGYRWYDTRQLPVRFPFGHGLSYATFEIGEPVLSSVELRAGELVTLEVPVTNTSEREGCVVLQAYVEPPPAPLFRPRRELRAFAKARLAPGERGTLALTFDTRAFSYWDPGDVEFAAQRERLGPAADFIPASRGASHREVPGWYAEAGEYRIHVARSVADVAHP
jgi:beta-glucosidase